MNKHDELCHEISGRVSDLSLIEDISSYTEQVSLINGLIGEFEYTPTLVDSFAEDVMKKIEYLYQHTWDCEFVETLCQIPFQICKIRSHKIISNYLSTDVYLVGQLIDSLDGAGKGYRRFFILLWLSKLVLVPFPLLSVSLNLDYRLGNVCELILAEKSNASKTQKLCAVVFSRFLTRLDQSSSLLTYLKLILLTWTTHNSRLGHLLLIKQLAKYYPTIMSPYKHTILNMLYWYLHQTEVPSSSVYVIIKVLGMLCAPSLSKPQYDEVAGIVNVLINKVMIRFGYRLDSLLREALAKSLSQIVLYMDFTATNYANQLFFYVSKLLNIGIFHDFHSDVNISSSDFSPTKYHVVLLFFGFLSLNKGMKDEHVPHVLSVVHQTLFISQRTISSTLSNQIRDSSCFCIWAIVRSLSHKGFKVLHEQSPSMFAEIFMDLVKVALLDEDFGIRRCAIATLQEFIGRFGDALFKKKWFPSSEERGENIIKVLELLDTPSISSLKVSVPIIHELTRMGFPVTTFKNAFLMAILNDKIPFELRTLFASHLAQLMSDSGERLDGADNLYFSAELLKHGALQDEAKEAITLQLRSFTYDHAKDRNHIGACLLHWYSVAYDHSLVMWQVLFDSSVLHCRYISREIENVFRSLQHELDEKNFELIKTSLKGSNQNIALALTAAPLSKPQTCALITLCHNTDIKAEVRAIIILSLKPHLVRHDIQEHTLVELLDDYTTTNQGDVGLKIRMAVMNVCTNLPKCRLIRLATESMDNVRSTAHEKLMLTDSRFKNVPANSDYDFYFYQMMNNSHFFTDIEKKSFWKGIVHSAGALRGTSALINKSFRQLLLYAQTLKSVEREMFRLLLLQLTVISSLNRDQKTVTASMLLIVKLFDAGFSAPEDMLESLFVRFYNLHINKASTLRIELATRLFRHLSILDNLIKARSYQRLVWLASNHRSHLVRMHADEALLELRLLEE